MRRASVALLVLAACSRAPAPAEPLVQVGPYRYSARDVELRAQLIQSKYPSAANPELGAVGELIKGALCAMALERMGEPITPEALDAELLRIDGSTRDPGGLAQMKALFGGAGTREYREVGILPDFANSRYFFAVFPKHPGVHQARKERATALRAELAGRPGPVDLATVAKERAAEGWEFHTYDTDSDSPQAHLDGAAPGALFGLEADSGWLIVRWTPARPPQQKHVEQILLPRRGAEDYLWEVAGTVPLRVTDARLREELKKRVAWIARLDLRS